MDKPLRHCTSSDLAKRSGDSALRSSLWNRKFSIGLLEEASELSKSIGMAAAARAAGMAYSTLRHYVFINRLLAGHKPGKNTTEKISREKKLQCYETYLMLLGRNFSKSKRKCWIEAGRITGVNGRSVEFQLNRGYFTP